MIIIALLCLLFQFDSSNDDAALQIYFPNVAEEEDVRVSRSEAD